MTINLNDTDNKKLLSTHASYESQLDSEHYVQFYDSEDYFLNSLFEYINIGLHSDEVCIIIATSLHRKILEQKLKSAGLNLSHAKKNGQYISLDAGILLSKFMVNDMPDASLFRKIVGEIIAKGARDGKNIKAFGEMVALLWAQGYQEAALKLEELWNELAKEFSFSLFCAYPMHTFDKNAHSDRFEEIVHSHSRVIPTESFSNLVTSDERLKEIAMLQQKAKSLEAEVIHRKKLEKQKDEFLGIASHELKTPLTSVKGYSQLLERHVKESGDTISLGYLGKMRSQLDKLDKLVSDLLDVSRIDEGKMKLNWEKFNYEDLVTDVISNIHITSKTHTLKKVGTFSSSVHGDKFRIEQVLTNLLHNAIKYSPEGNTVIVTLEEKDNGLTVSVEDFGIGIPEERIEHVFKKFYRVEENPLTEFPGLGLGLYISSEIVKQHKGQIWVTSKKDKGTIFSFSIPVMT